VGSTALVFGSFVARGCVCPWTQFTSDEGGCPHSLVCSELVAEFHADINGSGRGADSVGEEVVVELGGPVAVDLVGGGHVELKVFVHLDGAVELGVFAGLPVVSHLDIDGLSHEASVVNGLSVLLTGEVDGDLGEVFPSEHLSGHAHGDGVVLAWGNSAATLAHIQASEHMS
jgi:hypothetical protein